MPYQIGQIVEGKITGIQPYGAFVALDEHTSGLVHISEISDGFVKDVGKYVKINDVVKVKIIDFDEKTKQARLSIKALRRNRVRNVHKTKRYGTMPVMKIGFKSIAEQMDLWVKEAEEKK